MKPSAAQIEAGNYAKDHVTAHGMRVSIENAKGSTRSGVSKTGKRWATKMEHDYGYIRGTSGNDGDHIDVFLGPHHADPSVPVHVVDQVDPDTGDFDEHKVMLGFKTEDDAIDAYHANYEAGWQGMKSVTPLSLDKFKQWAFTDGARKKPVSEHSISEDEIRAFAGGGFVGYKSAGRRPEAHNDRASAADMPLQAARGWAAGTAGLPGDIESLTRQFIRMLGGEGSPAANVDAHPVLPTSEFYKEWLPGAPEGASSRAAGELGSLLGGAGAGTLARGAAKVGKFAARGAAEQIAKGLEGQGALSQALRPAAPMYAVKPRGGNWLPDGVNEQVNNVSGENLAAAAWLNKNLRKYIRNDLGTATDPLLKLEQEGRLHLSPDELLAISDQHGISQSMERETGRFPVPRRIFPGSPAEFHKAATGRDYRTPWENLSDAHVAKLDKLSALDEVSSRNWSAGVVEPNSAEELMSMMERAGRSPEELAEAASKYGWLDKLNPGDAVYDLYGSERDNLGFTHIRDYLGAALGAGNSLRNFGGDLNRLRAAADNGAAGAGVYRAATDLTNAGLHLTPEQLQRSSFADIVAKTGDWNKLLANQKPMADLNKGIKQVHRQYDTGHQWVELSPEGLAGEGAAMRHCVGGYCSQVESGNTRILSLRNAEGQPVTTVEVGTMPNPFVTPRGTLSAIGGNTLRRDHPGVLEDYQRAFDASGEHSMQYAENLPGWLKANHPDVWSATVGAPPPSVIRQIKGRFNMSPPEDAFPHIQDLIKNGLSDDLRDWGGVGDMENSGLILHKGKYLTPQELSDSIPPAPDFKAGGAVRFNDGGSSSENSDGSSGGVDNGSQDGASGSLGDSTSSGITNTAGYADRQGVTGANTDSSTNSASSSQGQGEGLSFDHMLADLALEQGITNTAGYAQRQGVTGANTDQSTNPNSSSGGTGRGINAEAPFSSTPLGGLVSFGLNGLLNGVTAGGYGMANTLTGATTGQSLTSRALDALGAAFDSPGPAPDAESAQSTAPGMPGGSVNDSGGLNYAINPVNNPGALSGLYAPAPVNTGTPAWADPLAVAGHALRVYDPVFTPGNPTV